MDYISSLSSSVGNDKRIVNESRNLALFCYVLIGFNIKNNDNASKKDEYLQVINETVMGNTYTYDIKYKGFTSKESIEATVTIQNDYIIDIMVTNTLDHYYDSHIKNTTYIKDIIINMMKLNKDIRK